MAFSIGTGEDYAEIAGVWNDMSNNVYGPVEMRHVLEMPATLKTVSG